MGNHLRKDSPNRRARGAAPRIALAAAVLALMALTASAADAADAPALTLEPITFETNDGRSVPAERGTFRVPEDHTDPGGRTLELAFVRFPSTAEEPGPPLVYLAGGPGGSGIAAARGPRFVLFEALTAIGDVIAFDQRGTGESEPEMGCDVDYALPLDRPGDREVAGEILAAAARRCAERLAERGVALEHYHTEASADDLDHLRRALGADKLSLWGISYGTHLTLATLRQHGDRVHRAVMAGVEPLHHTLKRPRDQQALLEEVARRAAADPEVSAVVPDLLGSIERLLDRLERQPVRLPLTDPRSGAEVKVAVGPLDLQAVLAGMLRGPDQLRMIPDLVARLEAGDWAALALPAAGSRLGRGFSGMSLAMDCASGAGDEWLARIEREAATTLLGDAINLPGAVICEGVPVPDLGDDFRSPVVSDVPVLLISGTLDGRTPPTNAEEVLPHLPNATHLVIDGSGHDLFLASPQVLEAMLAFFRGEELPTRRIDLPPMELVPPRTVVELPTDTLERYVGDYRIAEGEVRRVILAGGLLFTRRGEGPTLPIRPLSQTRFFYEGNATWLEFRLDDDGEVTGMVMHHDGAEEGEPALRPDSASARSPRP